MKVYTTNSIIGSAKQSLGSNACLCVLGMKCVRAHLPLAGCHAQGHADHEIGVLPIRETPGPQSGPCIDPCSDRHVRLKSYAEPCITCLSFCRISRGTTGVNSSLSSTPPQTGLTCMSLGRLGKCVLLHDRRVPAPSHRHLVNLVDKKGRQLHLYRRVPRPGEHRLGCETFAR